MVPIVVPNSTHSASDPESKNEDVPEEDGAFIELGGDRPLPRKIRVRGSAFARAIATSAGVDAANIPESFSDIQLKRIFTIDVGRFKKIINFVNVENKYTATLDEIFRVMQTSNIHNMLMHGNTLLDLSKGSTLLLAVAQLCNESDSDKWVQPTIVDVWKKWITFEKKKPEVRASKPDIYGLPYDILGYMSLYVSKFHRIPTIDKTQQSRQSPGKSRQSPTIVPTIDSLAKENEFTMNVPAIAALSLMCERDTQKRENLYIHPITPHPTKAPNPAPDLYDHMLTKDGSALENDDTFVSISVGINNRTQYFTIPMRDVYRLVNPQLHYNRAKTAMHIQRMALSIGDEVPVALTEDKDFNAEEKLYHDKFLRAFKHRKGIDNIIIVKDPKKP